MADPTNGHTHPRDAARQNRLRAALRENLKRRKSQARGRADLPDASTADPNPTQEPHADQSQHDDTV